MKYVVLMNNKYMNSFKNFTEAYDEREKLEKAFPKAKIEIISYERFINR